MIAALYARVSTQRQENEETIETQVLACKDFAQKNGHTIIQEHRDDGWTGTILVRPALDELRLTAKNKLWEAVIVYDPDRIARKYSYQALVIDELEERGIKVLFVTTPPAKTDEDKLLYGVKGIFAEYEKARIADRFRLGKLRKARDGHVVTSHAPYGYTYIPKQGDQHGYYQINENEVSVVRTIFQWVGDEGLTLRKVVNRLHEQGIPPQRSKRGVWNTSSLTNILRNESYVGTAHYLRSYGTVPLKPLKNEKYKRVKKTSKRLRPREEWIAISVPSIIDRELFDKVQEQLKKNFMLCIRNRKNDYLLAGHIFCVCGRRRTGEGPQRGKHLYYRCSDRVYSFPLPPKCIERGVNARIADELVWQEIKQLMSSPDLLKQQVTRWLNKKKEQNQNLSVSVEPLREDLNKLNQEEKRYLQLYGRDIIGMEELERILGELRLRKATLEQRIAAATNSKTQSEDFPLPTDTIITSFATRAQLALQSLPFERKRAIIEQAVDKVVATQEELKVFGYLPVTEPNHVKFYSNSRNYRVAERWKIDAVQRHCWPAAGVDRAVPVRDDRAEHRRRRRAG